MISRMKPLFHEWRSLVRPRTGSGIWQRAASADNPPCAIRIVLCGALSLAAVGSDDCAAFISIHGDNQVGPPGSLLPEELEVRSNFPGTNFVRFHVVFDGTGGARLGNGELNSVVALGSGDRATESLTLGPDVGTSTVEVCEVSSPPTALELQFRCGPGAYFLGAEARPSCPQSPLTVSVTATGEVRLGRGVYFTAEPHCGADGYTYSWDVDGDGYTDSSGTSSILGVEYSARPIGSPTLRVMDAAGTTVSVPLPVDLQAPRLVAMATGAATPLCGDGDDQPEPGERWRLPLRIRYTGNLAAAGGVALFAASDRLEAALGGSSTVGKLEIENPVVEVGDLAPGSDFDTSIDVRLDPDANCGARYGLRYMGSADAAGDAGSGTELVRFDVPAAPSCQVSRVCAASTPVQGSVVPVEGRYSSPTSRLALNLVPTTGDERVISGLWVTGDSERASTWYAVQGPMSHDVAVSPIDRYTRDVDASDFKVGHRPVGNVTLGLRNSTHAILSWYLFGRSGTELLSTFRDRPVRDYSGAWFHPAEAGAGLIIESEDLQVPKLSLIDATNLIYDSSGQPRWTTFAGLATDSATGTATDLATTFTGFNVPCPGCPAISDRTSNFAPVGFSRLQFDNANQGRFSTDILLRAPQAGSWLRRDQPIVILTKPR